MDKNDSVLGAYHGWVKALAGKIEHITVICLYEGEHDLPSNVRVYSLGKEKGSKTAFIYAFRFISLAYQLRGKYDRVFVHMNQEYLLIAGWLWKLLGKRMYLWRNHYSGSFLTDLAAAFCTKVFCTSKHSYTAKYTKTEFMPVGINESLFTSQGGEVRELRSILFLARIAPSKHLDVFIEALGLLIGKGVSFIASVYGSPLPGDAVYYESMKARAEALGLHSRVRFHTGIPNRETPAVYRAHEIFVNCSQSGMFDKTLFEAAASGCFVIAASDDFEQMAGSASGYDGTPQDLANRLDAALAGSMPTLMALASEQSLTRLVGTLAIAMEA